MSLLPTPHCPTRQSRRVHGFLSPVQHCAAPFASVIPIVAMAIKRVEEAQCSLGASLCWVFFCFFLFYCWSFVDHLLIAPISLILVLFVRTHASEENRTWVGRLRPLGHPGFFILLIWYICIYFITCMHTPQTFHFVSCNSHTYIPSYTTHILKNAWMAERSKAADLSSVIFGCVGSNPTSGNSYYNFFVTCM